MTRKVLPREWAAIGSSLLAILGLFLPPETMNQITLWLSQHAGHLLTTLGLLGNLGASARIVYVGKKEARDEAADPDNRTV